MAAEVTVGSSGVAPAKPTELFKASLYAGIDAPDHTGKRFLIARPAPTGEVVPLEIVLNPLRCHVYDVKRYGLERPMRPGVYHPLGQNTPASMAIALKTDGDPEALVRPSRREGRPMLFAACRITIDYRATRQAGYLPNAMIGATDAARRAGM